MGYFKYKDIYVDEDGRRVQEVNILPEKHCPFNCVCCSIGKGTQVELHSFNETESSLNELENVIENSDADLFFIKGNGEPLVNDNIENVINLIKSKGKPVKLYSNGYLLGKNEYMKAAKMCDEVIGCLGVASEEGFQKIHRPFKGYTFDEFISNMISFSKQYNGKFILKVTILKGYNDSEEAVNITKNIINQISPAKLIVEKMRHERFQPAFGISDERLKEISRILFE